MNIDLIREETPGCACPNPRVHFNNAGAALPPKQVVEAIKQHLDVEACLGGYEAAKLAQEAFAKVYFDIAALINASDPAEIACVENATRAYDYILYSIVYNDTTHPAQSIIVTSSSEYGSNQIALMQVARQRKARIQLIPCTIYGSICVISLSHFLQQYHEEVIVVSLTWIPTNGGIINPAAEVGEVCRRYKVPFLLDACQAVGQINVDVQALKCDALCATGRKYVIDLNTCSFVQNAQYLLGNRKLIIPVRIPGMTKLTSPTGKEPHMPYQFLTPSDTNANICHCLIPKTYSLGTCEDLAE